MESPFGCLHRDGAHPLPRQECKCDICLFDSGSSGPTGCMKWKWAALYILISRLCVLAGDGISELAVGGRNDAQNRGALFLLMLDSKGKVIANVTIDSDAGIQARRTPPPMPTSTCRASTLLRLSPNSLVQDLDEADFFGQSVSVVQDLDWDSVPELIVGAPGDAVGLSGVDGWFIQDGAAHVVFLKQAGSVKSSVRLADGQAPEELSPFDSRSGFGYSVLLLNAASTPDGIHLAVVGANRDADNIGAIH
eukprot:3904637-Pleurochrysis_carterae.AAC.1